MLNQVLQVIGVTQNEEQRMEAIYNDFQRPPKIDIALMHAAATKFAKTDPNIDLDKTNVCPCCGLPTVIEELPLCSSRNEFSFNGSGIALYFDFLVFSGVIIFQYMYCPHNKTILKYKKIFNINTVNLLVECSYEKIFNLKFLRLFNDDKMKNLKMQI